MRDKSPLAVAVCLCFAISICSAKDVTVSATGDADFKTVQSAIDSVPADNKDWIAIHVKPGRYEEHLTLAKGKAFFKLIGGSAKPEETILTFHLKASDPKTDGTGNVGTTGSASTTIAASDVVAENLTFENSAGDNVGQAVALKTTGDRLIFRNCRFLGFQDTLYPAGEGRCYFKDCYITGDTDFIFGNAIVVFDHCTINSTDVGWTTAANTSPNKPTGYVFLDCTLTASPNVKDGTVFLGRPWQWDRGTSASVTYVRTKMGKHISPAGWHPWDLQKNTDPGKHARYAESGSLDADGKPLDISQRVPWSKQLTDSEAADLTPAKVLAGEDHWDPTTATSSPAR